MQRPEVIFYVLASTSQHERQAFACKLIEKIYRSGEFCYVLTQNTEQAVEIDKLLWTFRAGSFVPHQLYQGQLPEYKNSILIGGNDIPADRQKIVVNLSSHFPPATSPTERILEILDNSEESKRAGRERYRHYLSEALQITTHKQERGGWIESHAGKESLSH